VSRARRAASARATSPRRARTTTPRRRRIADALPALGSRDWTVLALVLVERLSLAEAACALEIAPDQFRRRYDRALARLRRMIAPWVSAAARDDAAARRAS
jgi:DNA-directed RNA polymerase specialized sigma24 family protein